MSEVKKFTMDVSWMFAASAASMLLASLVTIIIARHLGAADLGLYKIALTFYGVATLIGALGLPSAIIKYVAEFRDDPSNCSRVVSSGIITALVVGLAFTALVYALSGQIAGIYRMPELASLLKLLSPVFPFVLVNATLFGLLNGLRMMNKYAIVSVFQSLALMALTLVLLYAGFGITGTILGLIVSAALTTAVLAATCMKNVALTLKGYLGTTRMLMAFGMKMLVTNLITTINLQADVIILGYFVTAPEVGYYAAATGLSRFFWIVPQTIQTVSYPATSEYWAKRNLWALRKMIDKSTKYSALALFPVGLTIGLFADEVIAALYGSGFSSSVLPLQVLVVATVIFGVFCGSIGATLAGADRPDLSLKITGLSAILNMALYIILIPRLGIDGAAIASAVSLIVNAALFNVVITRTLSVKIDMVRLSKSVILAFASALIFFVGRSYVNHYVLGLVILAIFMASISMLLLTKDDLDLLKSVIMSCLKAPRARGL